jgi:methyl-accepting chemotaxis protein
MVYQRCILPAIQLIALAKTMAGINAALTAANADYFSRIRMHRYPPWSTDMEHRQAMISDQPKPTSSTFLANLKIGTKLLLGFGAVLLTAVGLGLFAIQSLEAVNEAAMEVRDDWLPSTALATELQSALQDFRIAEARHVMAATDAERDGVEAELKVLLDRIGKIRADYDPLVTPGEERGYVTSFDRDWSDYREGARL